ncbi:MAG: ferrochelatase [Legionellales bacterium]|nr:ferrochelatase [Legionellales bacterium]
MTFGVLLTNLGTPTAPTAKAVRRYLAEFLSDPRVIEIPQWIWWWILHGAILPFRPRQTAKLYQKIWQTDGSPLLTTTQQQAQLLQQQLDLTEHSFHVVPAMRYGEPSIAHGLQQLLQQPVQQLIVLPLYPQYSATTTASTFDAVSQALRQTRHLPQLHFIQGYASQTAYIDALTASIEHHWHTQGRQQKLIFSFHGLPQRFVDAGDPYYQQCQQTAAQVTARLPIAADDCLVTFQSRFGSAPWLQPYFDKTLETLPSRGITGVDVICPGFAADCLETLEEVTITNRHIFQNAGGQHYHYIPALNTQPSHIKMMKQLVLRQAQNWI